MKRTTFVSLIVILVFISIFSMNRQCQADEQSLGKQAEQAGNQSRALTHYVSALQELWANGKYSQELNDKIITLSRELDSPPVVPEEAERHMARGSAAVKAAGSPKDFDDAVKEFESALYYAPWVAEIYYNLGVVQDKAGKYEAAIWALNMYLKAKPNSEDARQVKNLIYEIEYRTEEAAKLKVKEEKDILKPADLIGNWSYINLMDERMTTVLNSQGDNVIFPKLISSLTEWRLKLQGFELNGIVRVNKHGQISGSCLSNNFEYFKREVFIDMVVEGKISRNKNRIVLRYEQPFIDKNKNCGVSYKHKEVEFIRN